MGNEIPEWITWVATGIGIAVSVIAARMGLSAGKNVGQTSTAEVAGALIDQKAAREITDALSASVKQYVDCHEEFIEFEKERLLRLERAAKDLTHELDELRSELRELGRDISHARSRST